MAAPYHKSMRKTEDVFEALLNQWKANDLTGVTIYKGMSFSDMSVPRIEIVSAESEPEIHGPITTGNFIIKLTVTLVENKGDATRGGYADHCAAIEDIIMQDDIVDQANNVDVSDFTMFELGWTPGPCRSEEADGEMRTEYEVTVYMKPSISED